MDAEVTDRGSSSCRVGWGWESGVSQVRGGRSGHDPVADGSGGRTGPRLWSGEARPLREEERGRDGREAEPGGVFRTEGPGVRGEATAGGQ